MRKIILLLLLVIPFVVNAQSPTAPPTPPTAEASADEVKTYYVVLYKKGPKRDQPKAEAEAIQKDHLEHLRRLIEMGILSIAGPMEDDADDVRGMLIFNSDSADQIKNLVNEDPAVQAGRLIFETHKWNTKRGACLP